MGETVNACPECDASRTYKRDSLEPPWRCQDCGHTFDTPAVRRSKKDNGEYVTTDELLENIAAVASNHRSVPTLHEYEDLGAHSKSTVYDRFDTWRHALIEAGVDPGGLPRTGKGTKYGIEDMSPEDVGLPPVGERSG